MNNNRPNVIIDCSFTISGKETGLGYMFPFVIHYVRSKARYITWEYSAGRFVFKVSYRTILHSAELSKLDVSSQATIKSVDVPNRGLVQSQESFCVTQEVLAFAFSTRCRSVALELKVKKKLF